MANFESARLKLEWANQHIADLKAAANAFTSYRHNFGFYKDAQSDAMIVEVRLNEPIVDYVAANNYVHFAQSSTPPVDDPMYPTQANLSKIEVEGAWGVTTGSRSVGSSSFPGPCPAR